MTETVSLGIPEQGQLVEVRHWRYVVTDAAKNSLPPAPLAPGNGKGQELAAPGPAGARQRQGPAPHHPLISRG